VKRWLVLAACGGAPRAVTPVALSHGAPIDARAGAVVEQGDAVYVLAGEVALIARGGIVTTRIESPRPWRFGASIAAPDGDGRWVVAVDDEGAPWRLTLSGEREPVAERLGLAGAKVRALGGAGTTFAADLGDSLAYTTDGVHLTRVPTGATDQLAVARGVLARVTAGHLERWDLAHGTRVSYALSPIAIGFLDGDHPRLVAVEARRLWVETDGKLVAFALPRVPISLAARGDRAWIAAAGELYLFDGKQVRPASGGDRRGALLAASSAGDAWLATDHGLIRYSIGASADDPAWQAQVAPVFQRVCGHCHLPGGEAGIDLSTAAAWQSERAEISRRVLTTRTMPPAGTELSDADRAALAAWLTSTSSPRGE
jgi:mono/diheme cytochrome c family protein